MNHYFYWQKATTNFFITIFSCIIICGFIACNNSGKGETADKDTGEKKSQQAVAPGAANVTATFTALRFEKADVERLYGSNTWHKFIFQTHIGGANDFNLLAWGIRANGTVDPVAGNPVRLTIDNSYSITETANVFGNLELSRQKIFILIGNPGSIPGNYYLLFTPELYVAPTGQTYIRYIVTREPAPGAPAAPPPAQTANPSPPADPS